MSGRDPRRRQVALLAAAGVAVSVVVVTVLLRFDRGGSEGQGRVPTAVPTDLPEPTPLTEEERRGAARGIDADATVGLERGAWVQVAAPDGSLEQEYRADRVEPLPDGGVRLERPRAILYRKDGRVVTLAADRGLARIAGRALEGGSLEGTVVIEMFRSGSDLAKGTPSLTVEASDAEFDGVLGEVRSEGSIAVRSGESRFDGEGLLLRVAPEGGGVERLEIDRATRPAVLVRRAGGEAAAPSGSRDGFAGASGAAGGTAEASTEAAPRFHRLVIERDVRIRRWLGGRRTELTGDRLEAMFSLEDARAGNLIAAREPAEAAVRSLPSTEAALVSMAIASGRDDGLPTLAGGPPAEGDEIATVEFAGSLTLVPLAAGEEPPARPDAVEATLVGSPATLTDSGDDATVTASSLRFRSIDDSVVAAGDAARELTIDSPRLSARGRSFSLSRKDGRGTFVGPGAVRLGEGGEQVERLASDPTRPVPEPSPPKSVTISFRDAVDLEMAAGDPGAPGDSGGEAAGLGPLRSAAFRGEVAATGVDFAVSGDVLAATFASDGGGSSLRQLRIEGQPVNASRRGDERRGTLLARRLVLELTPDSDGDPAPDTLRADGGVVAADEDQALRTRTLAVGFVEDPEGNREVGPVAAEGEVAIALADGVRAWGERLDADAIGRTVRIQGGPSADGVAIARERTLVDRVRDVRFAEEDSAARADGPGRVRSFATDLFPAGLEPGPRPAVDAAPTMLAEWNDGLSFRETPEGGQLDIAGSVRVRSTPDRSSTDALDAAGVRLTLAAKGSAGDDAARELLAFIATGGNGSDAKLESRRWKDSARGDDPRLFRLTGGEIRYRPPTREGEVPGAGTLLVHLPAAEGPRGEVAAAGVSLGAEGTTRFRWAKSLALRSAGANDRFRVDLDGDVEVLHAGIGEGRAAGEAFSLRADRIGVDLERTAAAGADAGVDLGGTAEILGLDAAGRVTARTGSFDLECGSFRFDAASRIATMTAAAGRDVTVVFRDGTPPVRAAEVRWDLAKGEIKATRVSGGR